MGQSKESARAAYDALRADKEELKLELVKYEERNKAMENELHHFHALVKTYASQSEDLKTQLELSETQRTRMQAGDGSPRPGCLLYVSC